MEASETKDVRDLLHKFQEGYTRRDQTYLGKFMELFVDGDELEVIGTNAVKPGEDEWCQGREAVQELIAGDWEHWGEVVLDVAGARIHTLGEVGWIATTGRVTDTIPIDEQHKGFIAYIKDLLEDGEKSEKEKMLDIMTIGNDILLGLPISDRFVWPFRFTAVVVKEGGKWRFHQMQYSFATTRSPDVRLA